MKAVFRRALVSTVAALMLGAMLTGAPSVNSASATTRKGAEPEARRCACASDPVLSCTLPPTSGPDVLRLQEALGRMGLFLGRPDGVYGPATAQAVREFQVRSGLPPTGAMDRRTWRAFGHGGGGVAATGSVPRLPGRAHILVDTARNCLTVYSDYHPVKEYIVATGKLDSPTPLGDWTIVSKDSWGEGFGTRWMGLSVPWGIYGIHGTNKPWEIGGDVSAGCVRMFNHDIEELFEWVEVGTPVKIIGHPLGPLKSRQTLENDYRGPNVLLVQKTLKEAGYYKGTIDGVYGLDTMEAVRRLQKAKKLPITGSFDDRCYNALNLIRFE